MELKYHNGLLFTTLEIINKNNVKVIENVVLDTGAVETIISPDAVEDIGIIAELDDMVGSFYGIGGSIHNYYTKKIDEVIIETVKLQQVKLNFGVIDVKGEINGLLGLDILLKTNAIIDLKQLSLKVF
jgi:hypothetical protein